MSRKKIREGLRYFDSKGKDRKFRQWVFICELETKEGKIPIGYYQPVSNKKDKELAKSKITKELKSRLLSGKWEHKGEIIEFSNYRIMSNE